MQTKLILFVLTLAAVSYLLFFPSFYANVDEHNYLRTSWKLSQGVALTESAATQALGGFANTTGEYVSKYNLGNSIWFAPVAALGINAVFLWSLATYFLIIYICYLCLKKLKIARFWLVGIILFPPLIFYARTLLSELPAALFFTLSYYAYLNLRTGRRYWLLLGISLGFLTLIRYNFALWGLLLVANIIFNNYRQLTKDTLVRLATLALGALPFLILFVLINTTLYGAITSSGYKFSGEEVLNWGLLGERLPWYLLMLNIVYPLQFVVLGLSKLPLQRILIIFSIFLILFYSVAGGFLFAGKITDPIVGIRFLFPILPVVLFNYFSVISRFQKKQLWALATLGLVLILIALSYQHRTLLDTRQQIYTSVAKLQAETSNVLFVGDEDDFIYLGEQFSSNFNNSGYKNIRDFTAEDLNNWSKVFLFKFDYPNRPDRPTEKMLKSIADFESQGKLKLITAAENFTIYEVTYALDYELGRN